MPIHDVVLFVSSVSEVCKTTVQFIRQNQLPVRLVRLDTSADRETAARGKYFQIHTVPTLLVTHTDGNIQLFVGNEKAISWLQQAKQSQAQHAQPPPPQIQKSGDIEHKTRVIESSEDEYIPKKQKRRTTAKKSRRKKKAESYGKPKSLYGGKPKKKKPPVTFVESDTDTDDEDGIVFIEGDEPPPPRPPQTDGLLVGLRAKNKKGDTPSIYDMAKQMEKERVATLGYREEDLPKYT